MKYDPKAGLLPDGEYDATIVSAEEKLSKKGNPMMELVVRVYGSGDQTSEISDWLMESQGWKLQMLCQAIGHNFESGDIEPRNLIDKNIRVRISTEENPKYGKQNRIGAYVGAASASPPVSDPDIPF